MTRKYHNHTLQTSTWHREEEKKNTNSQTTVNLLFVHGLICCECCSVWYLSQCGIQIEQLDNLILMPAGTHVGDIILT